MALQLSVKMHRAVGQSTVTIGYGILRRISRSNLLSYPGSIRFMVSGYYFSNGLAVPTISLRRQDHDWRKEVSRRIVLYAGLLS